MASGSTSAADLEHALRLVLFDGVCSEAMGTLTTGVFLASFALELGASNFVIGLLAAIPFLVQLLQIPAVVLVERLRRRRLISAWASLASRVLLFPAAATPFLPAPAAIVTLVITLGLYQGLGAIGGCAWNSWMRDLVPEDRFGRFFGRRTIATTALSITLGVLGSFFLDTWRRDLPAHAVFGYSWLFVLGGLIGLYGVYLLLRTPEPAMAPADPTHPLRLLSAPFHDGNFRRLIAFLASWNFASNLAAPFFTVYMLKSLDFPMTLVVGFTILSQLSNLAFLGPWGTLIDRYNNKSVLRICAPLFLFCILAWTLTDMPWAAGATLPILAVLHMLMGISTAGVTLASSNIAMKLSPPGQSTAYLAANSVAMSCCAGVAPIIGGLCADFFAAHQLTLSFVWKSPSEEMTLQVLNFRSWTFFFGMAFLAGLYSLHRLSVVRETGEVRDRVVLQQLFIEARRSMGNLSSVAGLARIVRFPMLLLRPRARRSVPGI